MTITENGKTSPTDMPPAKRAPATMASGASPASQQSPGAGQSQTAARPAVESFAVTVRYNVASVPCAALAYLALIVLRHLVPANAIGEAVLVGVPALLALGGYLLAARGLRLAELDLVWDAVGRRLRGQAGPA